MVSEVLNYVSPKLRSRVQWYHWIPLAVLLLLLLVAGIYAWLHWNDRAFWDL